MTIQEYKDTLKNPLREMTEVFLIKGDQIMLGIKKTGFGQGNLVGIGGKLEKDEKIEEAAKREFLEETEARVNDLKLVATLDCYFPHNEEWNQKIYTYFSKKWEGEIKETKEIQPIWFNIAEIPFEKMWDDVQYWLPFALDSRELKAEFLFNEDLKVVDYHLVFNS